MCRMQRCGAGFLAAREVVRVMRDGGRRGEGLLPRARFQTGHRGIDQDGRAAGVEPRVMPRLDGGGVVSVPGGWRPSGLRGPAGELRGSAANATCWTGSSTLFA